MNTLLNIPRQPVLDAKAMSVRAGSANIPSLLDLPARVMTHSGRSAIAVALDLSGAKSGDRVLVPSYHCPTMISPVVRAGCVPVFYPISETGDPVFSGIVVAPRLRAMLVPHLFGIQRPMCEAVAFCRAHNISLIEDCAHCFFGAVDGVPVGSSGDFAIGSLPKFFPVIEGGLLASARRDIVAPKLPVRKLRDEARAVWDIVDISTGAGRLGAFGLAFARARQWRKRSRAPEEADVGHVDNQDSSSFLSAALSDPLVTPLSIRRIESWLVSHADQSWNVLQRRKNYIQMKDQIVGQPRIRFLPVDIGPACAPYVLPILVDNPDAAYAEMRRLRLPVFRWDRRWPGTPAFDADAASTWSRGLVQIACHQSLRTEEVSEIVRLIAGVVGGRAP